MNQNTDKTGAGHEFDDVFDSEKNGKKAGAKKALDPKFKAEVDQKYIDNTINILNI